MEETHVAYRQPVIADEGHPLDLDSKTIYRQQTLTLLVIDSKTVYHDVVREEPAHTTKAYTGTYAVLQFSSKKHRHTLLHPWRVHEQRASDYDKNSQGKSKLNVSTLLYFHFAHKISAWRAKNQNLFWIFLSQSLKSSCKQDSWHKAAPPSKLKGEAY